MAQASLPMPPGKGGGAPSISRSCSLESVDDASDDDVDISKGRLAQLRAFGPPASPRWCSKRFGVTKNVGRSARANILLHIHSCRSETCATCLAYVATHECQVCQEPIGRDLTKVWVCATCAKPLHLRCMRKWAKASACASCVYCRAVTADERPRPWRTAPPKVKRGVQSEGEVTRVLAHHVYPGARAGSLHNVYVRVAYADGGDSGREYVPAASLVSETARAALRSYSGTPRGARIDKYIYPRVSLTWRGGA